MYSAVSIAHNNFGFPSLGSWLYFIITSYTHVVIPIPFILYYLTGIVTTFKRTAHAMMKEVDTVNKSMDSYDVQVLDMFYQAISCLSKAYLSIVNSLKWDICKRKRHGSDSAALELNSPNLNPVHAQPHQRNSDGDSTRVVCVRETRSAPDGRSHELSHEVAVETTGACVKCRTHLVSVFSPSPFTGSG